MKTAVVIPVGAQRLQNLLFVLETLNKQTSKLALVVLVCDGPDAHIKAEMPYKLPTAVFGCPKHEPGKEQPRNLGVRLIEDLKQRDMRFAGITHVWFLDTDVIVRPRALEMYERAMEEDPTPRILVGPYDWLPPDVREPVEDLKNDPRWVTFDEYGPKDIFTGDLSAGLGCFSGNLVWPIELFSRVGGFWNDLHHGRCEDGELGLRAVAMGMPISFVPEARGWHLHHERNIEWIVQANARDVPMLNERHPWVEGEGLFVVEEDGKRFNCRCPICGEEMNTAEIWAHQGTHRMEEV